MLPARCGPRRLLGLASAVLVALGSIAVQAGAAFAQSHEQIVNTRRLEYQKARKDYEAAQAAFNVVDQRFSNALTEFAQARRSGNQEAIDRAFADAQVQSVAQGELQQRVSTLADKLHDARQALVEAISARLEELLAEMDAASSRQHRQDLQAVFNDLSNELQDLDAEAQDQIRLSPVALPDITYDPRDTGVELEQKAQILERRAAMADTAIEVANRRISHLQERQRLERQRRDFMAGAGRFDDTRTPVLSGSGGDPNDRSAVADSTGLDARPVTLQQRIDELVKVRQQLEARRDQLLVRAREFRRHVRMVT